MSRKFFHSKLRALVTLVAVVFVFGMKGYSQTIGPPTISAYKICAGSSITVTIPLTDGNGQNKQFVEGSSIIISLYEPIVGTVEIHRSFIATTEVPSGSNTISRNVIIPQGTSYSTNYQILVNSDNPKPLGNKPGESTPVTIDATITNNLITGDQSGCNPYVSEILTGAVPSGGNTSYSYLWESSTTDPINDDFTPAPGTNDAQDYNPGTLTQTTWFKRVVTSGACTNESNVVKIKITNDNTWTGNIDTDWNTPANWSCIATPIPVTNVIIPSNPASNNYPVLNTGAAGTANNLTIESGATVTISANTLKLGGNIYNNGTFDTQNGSLNFVGTSAQTLPADCLVNNRIVNLAVDNPSGLSLNGPVEVTGTVLAKNGDIDSAGNLKLISDATQTALINGTGTGEVLGNVLMQRYLDVAYGYKYFSTPFQNTTVGDFSTFIDLKDPVTKFPHFYSYDENRQSSGSDASGWVINTILANNLTIGRGYAVNFGSNSTSKLVELSGEVNNSQIDLVLQNNNGFYTNGFNLMGNPYPSPIDWNVIAPTLSGIDNAIYFYTASSDNKYTGTYTAYVNGVSTDDRSSNLIPSMQGFFVRVSDPADNIYPTTGTLSFTNAARTENQVNQEFYKSKSTYVKPQIKLTAGFSNEKTSDPAVIYFNDGATNEFEKNFDALKLLNNSIKVPNLYSITNKHEKLSINAVSSGKAQEIPLGIKTERLGKMFIKLANLENIFPSLNIYLRDLQEKVVHNLSEISIYSFTSQKGEINDRFLLILSSEKLSEVQLNSVFMPFSVYTSKGEIVIKLNLPDKISKNLILSNISGQILQNKMGKGKEELRFGGITAPGVYLVSLKLENEWITKKILLNK